MTQAEWINLISGIVVGLIIPGYFAWKRGKLNDFLTKEMEPTLSKVAKDHIKDKALAAGVQGVLAATLKANGLAKKGKGVPAAPPAAVLLLLVLPALAGCKSTEPFRLSLEGVVNTSRTVNRELVKSPLTPGEQALLDASNYQLDAAQKLVDAGK